MRVSCSESGSVDAKSAMYVLQVFDAETRRLLASATSMTPAVLEVTDLPAERGQSGLVLFLRVMTAHATSDAAVLHSSQHMARDGSNPEHQIFPGTQELYSSSRPSWDTCMPIIICLSLSTCLIMRSSCLRGVCRMY